MTEDERKLAYVEQQLASGRQDGLLKQVRREIQARLARKARATPVASTPDPEQLAARMAAAARKAVEG